MENSLWTFGCSFTAEYHPIDNDPPTSYDLYKQWKGGKLPKIWAELLSEKLNLKYENKGKGATSNASIFYSFCDYCKTFKENDIVIIQWTSIYRFLFANPVYNHLQDMLPSEEYPAFKKEHLEYIFVNRTNDCYIQELISYTKVIMELCKEKKVKLFFWTYNDTEYIPYIEELYSDFVKEQWITDYSFNTLPNLMIKLSIDTKDKHTILNETNNEVDDMHLGEIGHKAQAEYFYNYIKKQI
tara:strand:- start:195 stop:917 length:723 start_codon:yes stop_codon:yes gene_type:complete